ncbi:hypothetical protein C0J52_24746 [Blattella germanica]|nr:hypothetical protein C0J52_24746 [Blattella germanica]
MSARRKFNLSEEVLPELKCQMCAKHTRPPIVICQGGHIICSNCQKSFPTCTNCKNPILKTRCTPLENLARKVLFPCDYALKGCSGSFSVDEIEGHLEECIYRSYLCPFKVTYYRCTWEGKLNALEGHIDEEHAIPGTKRNIFRNHQAELNNVNSSNSWFQILFLEKNIFFMYSEQTEAFINCCILYVGPKTKAGKFKYSMTIVTQNGEGSSASMTFVAKHYETDVKAMFENCECPCFNMAFVKRCLDTSNSLKIYMQIMENQANLPS